MIDFWGHVRGTTEFQVLWVLWERKGSVDPEEMLDPLDLQDPLGKWWDLQLWNHVYIPWSLQFCPFWCCREFQEAEVFQALMGFRVQRWALVPVKSLNGTMVVLIGMEVSYISCFWTGHSGRTRTARVSWHQRVSWRPGTWWRARPDGSSGKNRISGFSSFSLEMFFFFYDTED